MMPPRSRRPPIASKRQGPLPKPPPTVVYCCLCKAEIDYANQNPGLFLKHLIEDHFCSFNHFHLLRFSLEDMAGGSNSGPDVVEDTADPVPVVEGPVDPAPPVQDKVVPAPSEFLGV